MLKGLRRAFADLKIHVQGTARRVFFVGLHLDHQTALRGVLPNLRFGGKGLADLGGVRKQGVGHPITSVLNLLNVPRDRWLRVIEKLESQRLNLAG